MIGDEHPFAAIVGDDPADFLAAIQNDDLGARHAAAGDDRLALRIDPHHVEARLVALLGGWLGRRGGRGGFRGLLTLDPEAHADGEGDDGGAGGGNQKRAGGTVQRSSQN